MATPAKIINFNLPTVVLVGRVNVGKSTIFNRLTETSQALISTVPGTTRTSNIGKAIWRGKQFQLVDTGGLTFSEDVPLEKDIIKQTETALKQADMILMIVDLQDNLLPQEKELAKKIIRQYRAKKPIILVGNKADSPSWKIRAYEKEWHQLGLGAPIAVSAINGSNIGDLLDLIYKNLKKTKKQPKIIKENDAIKITIAGRPNVGKSSLFNKLIGEPRVIVNPMPHTTREPHDTLVEVEDEKILFVDTAGIRRKAKVSGALEKLGIGKSFEAIKRSDIVIFLLDATEPVTDQDQQLGGFLSEHAKSVIIAINKWDMAEENTDNFKNEVKKMIYNYFPHLDYAPIIFISALTEYHIHQIFPLIKRVWKERHTAVSPEALREFLRLTIKQHLPARGKGVRHPQILQLKQLGINPPVFQIVIKYRTSLHLSYVNFLKKRMREKFGFFASPIIIKLTKLKK